MEIKELNNDGLTIRLAFHFVAEDYAEGRKKILNRIRRNADIKGFRKGMAPASLIEKAHGGEALVESINTLISENLNKYIEENKLSIIGEPLPVEDDEKKNTFANGEEFDFTFDIALAPKFDVSLSAEDKIAYYTVPANETEKEAYKKNIYKQFSKLETCDAVKDGDFLIADFIQGDRKVENSYISTTVLPEEGKALFIGKKAGDEFDIDVVAVFNNETDRAAMLKMKKEELAETAPVWHLVVKEVKNYVDAVPGQELYDQMFGKDVVKTEEEFNAEIEKRLVEELKQESDYRFMLDARKYLIDKANIALPENFLKRWLFTANEGKFTMEEIEKDFPLFLQDFRWQSIANKIITDNKLEINRESIKAEAIKLAQYQFAMYGIANAPADQLENFAEMILKDEKQSRRLFEKAEETAVLAFLRRVVTLENKEISSEELRKMNN